MVAVQSHCCEGHAWRLGTSWYRIRCQTFPIFWCQFQPFFPFLRWIQAEKNRKVSFFFVWWVLSFDHSWLDLRCVFQKMMDPQISRNGCFRRNLVGCLVTNLTSKAWSSLWSGWLQWFWENHLDGKVQKSRVRTSWGWRSGSFSHDLRGFKNIQ